MPTLKLLNLRCQAIGYLALILFIVVASYTESFASNFSKKVEDKTLIARPNSEGMNITFLGTTSFLIEDKNTQILIDGFVSRQHYGLFNKFGPKLNDIESAIKKHKFKKVSKPIKNRCHSSAKGLQLVIPVHGHYDHAMDASYFAAWASSILIADKSIKALYNASKNYAPLKPHEINWDRVQFIPPFKNNNSYKHKIKCGKFTINLIRSHHLETVVHLLLNDETKDTFQFPSTTWKMQEGTNFSIHIQYENRSIFISPSVGLPYEQFKKNNFNADIVFLGIGGMSIKSKKTQRNIWEQVVEGLGAKRVFPIHWDSDKQNIHPNSKNFKPARPFLSNRVLNNLESFADTSRTKIELLIPPAAQKFNPFYNLN